MKLNTQLFIIALIFSCWSCTQDGLESTNPELDSTSNIPEETYANDNIIPGEYIVVFKEDTQLKSLSLMDKYEIPESEIKSMEKVLSKEAEAILAKNVIKASKLDKVYLGAVNGFKLSNIDQDELDLLKLDSKIESIEPNRIYNANLPTPVLEQPLSSKELIKYAAKTEDENAEEGVVEKSLEIPVDNTSFNNGEIIPWGVRWIGRRNGRELQAKVYVIDSGIARHPDLNIFAGQSRSFIDGEGWEDVRGHGTHVAGIIGAKRNRRGVVGVSEGIRMVAVKILDADGNGTVDGLISGLNYAFNRANPQDAFNLSAGPPSRFTSNALDNAVRNLSTKIVGAISAGNNNDNTRFYSPTRINESRTWIVGSLENNIRPSGFSNFGNEIDRWAPGGFIISTWLNGDFQVLSGTSMAAPHVTACLVQRGDNTVRRRGTASKGGFTDPVARM